MGWRSAVLAVAALAIATGQARAQISLASAVDLALKNDPRIKMAQADLAKAHASLSEARFAYVPSITATGGFGTSTGVPVGLPVIFSFSAQSLAFNFSQPDYIRGAAQGVLAAELVLKDAQQATMEDTVLTYVALDNALQRKAGVTEANGIAGRLVQITQDRLDAGVDSRMDLTQAKMTAVRMRLQQRNVDNEIATLNEHLAHLIGIRSTQPATLRESIPEFAAVTEVRADAPQPTDSFALQAAFASARAKSYVARGDSRYRWRPQFGFAAGYSRISTVGTNYIQYYPGFDPARHPDISYNSLDLGVQISVPLLDLVHQAKARGTAADAAHARFEAENARMQFLEGRQKLANGAGELSDRAELASLERQFAQDQLDALEVQLQAAAGASDGPQKTPKDEQNGRLQERQKYLEYLAAELQLRQAQVTLMRQSGELAGWMHAAMPQLAPLKIAPQPNVRQPALPAAPQIPPMTHP